MRYLKSETYRKDIETAIKHTIGFDVFSGKSVLILGASGLIGSFITDCFIYANEYLGTEIKVHVVSRNIERLEERFGNDIKGYLNFIKADVTTMDIKFPFDYMIHGASYGHPTAFREMPVEVLLSNVIGTQRALEIAKLNAGCRVLYISSGEVQEYVDHLSVRACYPMGKRAAETLCISYNKEYGIDVMIARPSHTFGANVLKSDNRATAQFIAAAARGINIEMNSAGEQVRTFSYVADCASGLLTTLAGGESGTVYGISSGESCSIRDFADKCADVGKSRVEIHVPSDNEKAEMSPIRNQIVDNRSLRDLGWYPAFSIEDGIAESIKIISEMSGI